MNASSNPGQGESNDKEGGDANQTSSKDLGYIDYMTEMPFDLSMQDLNLVDGPTYNER